MCDHDVRVRVPLPPSSPDQFKIIVALTSPHYSPAAAPHYKPYFTESHFRQKLPTLVGNEGRKTGQEVPLCVGYLTRRRGLETIIYWWIVLPPAPVWPAQVSQEESSCSHVIVLLQFFLSQYQFSTFPTNSGGSVSQITKLLPLEGSGPMLTFLTTASHRVLLLGLLLFRLKLREKPNVNNKTCK